MLLQLGHAERLWPLLQHSPDPRLRTWIIHKLSSLGSDPQSMLQRLEVEREVSIRRALLLGLGEFTDAQLPPAQRQSLFDRLLRLYRDEPDAGLHGAVEWLLRRWGQAEALVKIDRELISTRPLEQRHWYVTKEGHTLVLLPGPVTFWMGSPASELERISANEPLHRRHIPRSFALATKEVSVAQFQRFLKAHPEVRHNYTKRYSPELDGPIVGVTWYEAAQYCRWLSEEEGLPEVEMCYPPIAEIKEGVRLPANYLSRTGYRLPTEAEWEYACRAGTVTSRYYGAAEELLKEYAWYLGNSKDRAWPEGRLKPNDWGFFDLYGNAAEWCNTMPRLYRLNAADKYIEDKESDLLVTERTTRVLRGASFDSSPAVVRSALRNWVAPAHRDYAVGLRPARTYR
jgi:formylglycine-generating enzyme required for sulfatase activity